MQPITEVSDQTFASKVLGEGVAIMPKEGKVVAPANGVISTLFQTNHAMGFTSDSGIELLIHIGIDTVKLGGKYFTAHCKEGAHVKKGDVLIEFDQAALEEEGFDTTVLVVVTNSGDYSAVIPAFETGAIFTGERLLSLSPQKEAVKTT